MTLPPPPPPKLRITNNADVPTLLSYYKKHFIDRNELSRLFNEVVRWEHRTLKDPLSWQGTNTWAKVYTAVQTNVISHEDYLFLAQGYEDHMDKKAREEWKM